MTEKLYYQDSHMSRFDARVTECRKAEKGFAVILDKTAFFPEGGGQLPDTGSIGTAEVFDVQEINGEILHYVNEEIGAGSSVHCAINYEQRLRRMQNHSGEHIVSGITHRLHGYNNVGFHMGQECMTLDFDGELDDKDILEIETLANKAVRDNLPITAAFPKPEELINLDYRSKLELTENVRIVTIEGIDCCACCAPHADRTGEVGIIKILEAERHRGGMRLSVVCGMDALDNYRLRQDSNSAISVLLSSKRDQTAQAVERLINERDGYKERISALSMELVKLKADSFTPKEGNICVFDDILDDVALRELVNLLTEKCSGLAAAFSGSDEKGWKYIIGSKTLDLRKNAAAINSGIGGRGGGKPAMIQGSAGESRENIEKFVENFSV